MKFDLSFQFPSVETLCVDISNWDETKRAIESIGDIDLLVNNAAVGKKTVLGEIDENVFDEWVLNWNVINFISSKSKKGLI